MEAGDDAASLDKLGPEASVFEALGHAHSLGTTRGRDTGYREAYKHKGIRRKFPCKCLESFSGCLIRKACFRSCRFGYSQSASLRFSDIGRSSKVTEVDLKFR